MAYYPVCLWMCIYIYTLTPVLFSIWHLSTKQHVYFKLLFAPWSVQLFKTTRLASVSWINSLSSLTTCSRVAGTGFCWFGALGVGNGNPNQTWLIFENRNAGMNWDTSMMTDVYGIERCHCSYSLVKRRFETTEMSQCSTILLADPPESARELKKSWSLYEQKQTFDAKQGPSIQQLTAFDIWKPFNDWNIVACSTHSFLSGLIPGLYSFYIFPAPVLYTCAQSWYLITDVWCNVHLSNEKTVVWCM